MQKREGDVGTVVVSWHEEWVQRQRGIFSNCDVLRRVLSVYQKKDKNKERTKERNKEERDEKKQRIMFSRVIKKRQKLSLPRRRIHCKYLRCINENQRGKRKREGERDGVGR